MSTGVWFVIPAFNEGEVLRRALAGVVSFDRAVVVVDDGSSDTTASIAFECGAFVCRHPVNLGQGAALQTGIQFALERGAQTIVTFDSDGQHRVEDALSMLAYLHANRVDVVLASRFLGSSVGMTRSKRALLKLATSYTRLQTGLEVTDTHNGLRVFSRSAASKIRLRHNRMAHASELLEQIAALKLRYAEHPCTIIYTDYSRKKGQRMTGLFRILLDQFIGRLYR